MPWRSAGFAQLAFYTIHTQLPNMSWATVNWALHINQTNQDRHPTFHFREATRNLADSKSNLRKVRNGQTTLIMRDSWGTK